MSYLKNKQLQTNENIIGEESITHLASFHAQQSIEKSLKGIIEEFDLGFVKTHNLERLFAIVENHLTESSESDTIVLLDQLYIDARYPGELGLLPFGKPSLKESERFFSLAKRIHKKASEACESKRKKE